MSSLVVRCTLPSNANYSFIIDCYAEDARIDASALCLDRHLLTQVARILFGVSTIKNGNSVKHFTYLLNLFLIESVGVYFCLRNDSEESVKT